MTNCRTNCHRARNNLRHNKRAQKTTSEGFQSLSLPSPGKRNDQKRQGVCLLRINPRAMLPRRAELIGAACHHQEGLTLLLLVFLPVASSAAPTEVPRGPVPETRPTNLAENHLPLLLLGGKPCQSQHKWGQGKQAPPYHVSPGCIAGH